METRPHSPQDYPADPSSPLKTELIKSDRDPCIQKSKVHNKTSSCSRRRCIGTENEAKKNAPESGLEKDSKPAKSEPEEDKETDLYFENSSEQAGEKSKSGKIRCIDKFVEHRVSI